MALDDNFDFQFKVILIGDSGVGKTSVLQHFASGVYSDDQNNTVKVDFILRSLDIDGKKVKMQLWDTAGQERYRAITKNYYREVDSAIIAYDITRRSSFESVPDWIFEVKEYGDTDTVIMLMGTKSDLCERRQVPFEEACALAKNFGLLDVLETSAKESRNINEAFQLMARVLIACNSLPPLSCVFYSKTIGMAACGQGSQGARQGSQGARQGSQGASQGSQEATQGSQGARQGSQGASQCSQCARQCSQGARRASQGSRRGSQGVKQGSKGARLGSQTVRLDSQGGSNKSKCSC